jgi:hypothetical protein
MARGGVRCGHTVLRRKVPATRKRRRQAISVSVIRCRWPVESENGVRGQALVGAKVPAAIVEWYYMQYHGDAT